MPKRIGPSDNARAGPAGKRLGRWAPWVFLAGLTLVLQDNCAGCIDPCADLLDKICDDCREEYCTRWEQEVDQEVVTSDTCLEKLDNYQDDILPDPDCREQ